MDTIQDKLRQKKNAIILEMNEKILDANNDREALAVATSVIVRNQMEVLDQQAIIHSEQIALSNLLIDLKKQNTEKKIILPH